MADAKDAALKSTLNRIVEQKKYKDYQLKISQISSEGANYSSRLYSGKISALNQPDLKWFGKVAIISEQFRGEMPLPVYQLELYAYTKILPIFDELQNKYRVQEEHRLLMPELYGYSEETPHEVIVLQDLGAQGFISHDRLQPFEWPYASKVVQQLATLHALFFALKHHYPEEYKRLHEFVKGYSINGNLVDILENGIRNTMGLIREEYRDRVEKYLENFADEVHKLCKPCRRPAVAHGDFKMCNVMHKIGEVSFSIHSIIYSWTNSFTKEEVHTFIIVWTSSFSYPYSTKWDR
jgi:hypothetical protein